MAYNLHENEELKNKARDILESNAPLEEKVKSGINLIEAYYQRAQVANSDRLGSISFEGYAALLLKACYDNIFKTYGDEVYNALVELYGLEDGLAKGKTYVMADEED